MKIGVIGTGLIAFEVAPGLRSWGIEPVAVCGTKRSADKVEELADLIGAPGRYTDIATMLAEADMDTVYIAVPNFLHYEVAKQAFLAGKHVICEKPLTSNYRQAKELADLAEEKGLFFFEAITTIYYKNYEKIREWLKEIGTVKIVTANFSQYSRRYDAFKAGEILPVFDPARSGGALMDLNLYNLHFIMGLFGSPTKVSYKANVERGIDTSGVLTLDYEGFACTAIAAKDCAAPLSVCIQGTEGYIITHSSSSICKEIILHYNDGREETFDAAPEVRFEHEFRAFVRAFEDGDLAFCRKQMRHSLEVCRVQTEARLSAGVVFPADEEQ